MCIGAAPCGAYIRIERDNDDPTTILAAIRVSTVYTAIPDAIHDAATAGTGTATDRQTRGHRRPRRSGYTEESVENIRQMMEDADPERKRQLKQDLEELMQEM